MAEPRSAESEESVRTTVIGEQVGVLNKVDHALASKLAERVIERYSGGAIDAVYLIFNEFKSVIQQRLVVERVLPIIEIGVADIAHVRELTQKEKEEAQKAAISAGVLGPEMWGVMATLSRAQKGWSGGKGSWSKTSSSCSSSCQSLPPMRSMNVRGLGVVSVGFFTLENSRH